MDPLKQSLAMHVGLITLDAIEAKTALADMTKQRDSALRQCQILREEMADKAADKQPAEAA